MPRIPSHVEHLHIIQRNPDGFEKFNVGGIKPFIAKGLSRL